RATPCGAVGQCADQSAQAPVTSIRVRHDYAMLKPEGLARLLQELETDRVEGAERNRVREGVAQERLETLPPLPCGLAGKGDAENLVRRHPIVLDEVCDPMDQ